MSCFGWLVFIVDINACVWTDGVFVVHTNAKVTKVIYHLWIDMNGRDFDGLNGSCSSSRGMVHP